MAGEYGNLILSFTAAADLSAKQYKFVKLASATTVNVAGSAEAAIGILQNKPTSGQTAEVMIQGVSDLVVGTSGVAAVMDKIASDTNGDGTTDSTDKHIYNAIALETGVDNDVISVLLTPCQTISA
jgi:hypothetical protein